MSRLISAKLAEMAFRLAIKMSDVGSFIRASSGRRISRQRRSIRLRSTDRAETFFDTTHAARGPPKGGKGVIESEKYSPCTRRAARGRRVKSARESRYFFGMEKLNRQSRATLAAAANQDVLAGSTRGTRAETVRPDAFAFLRLPIPFR